MDDYLDNMIHPGKQNHKLDHNITAFRKSNKDTYKSQAHKKLEQG